MLLLVAVIQLAFPGLMADAASQLRTLPWSSLGRGIVGLVVAVVVAGLLFVSVIGIPLGAAVSMTIAILALLGLVAVSYGLGLFIGRRRIGTTDIKLGGRIGWAIAGAIVLGIVAVIPVVGGPIVALAIAAGIGAASGEIWKRLRTA
ncbi:MAG: hypothetical protein OEU92_30950 [Alphaproteobacteria bacterium]|nr:hypothetical protein [Alphaproteobacteria bacterium]